MNDPNLFYLFLPFPFPFCFLYMSISTKGRESYNLDPFINFRFKYTKLKTRMAYFQVDVDSLKDEFQMTLTVT